MKKIIFGVITLLVVYSSSRAQNCQCTAGPTASFYRDFMSASGKINGNSITICQPAPFYGVIMVHGEVHPLQSNNTGQWESNIVYTVNGSTTPPLYWSIPYTEGMPSNNLSKPFSITNFQAGLNTIQVAAKCGSKPLCPIRTLTVNMIKMIGTVTLTTKCCTDAAGKNTGQTRLLMSGSINCGNAYLKVEKQVGTGWSPAGNIIPFVNGNYTPCYSKSNSPIFNASQTYRVKLVDGNGYEIPNTGTIFPWTFQTSCPIPPR